MGKNKKKQVNFSDYEEEYGHSFVKKTREKEKEIPEELIYMTEVEYKKLKNKNKREKDKEKNREKRNRKNKFD